MSAPGATVPAGGPHVLNGRGSTGTPGAPADAGRFTTIALVVAWAVGLTLLGAAVYAAPEAVARLTTILCIAAVGLWLFWQHLGFGLAAVLLATSSLIPRSRFTVPVAGLRVDLADLSTLALIAIILLWLLQGRRVFVLQRTAWPIALLVLSFAGGAAGSAAYARLYLHVNLGLVLGELRPAVYCATCAFVAAAAVRRGELGGLITGLFIVADLTAAAVILGQFVPAVRAALPVPPEGIWQINQQGNSGGGFGTVRLVPPAHVLLYLMATVGFCRLAGRLERPDRRGLIALQLVGFVVALLLTFTRAQWIASVIALLICTVLAPSAVKRRLLRAVLIALLPCSVGAALIGTGLISPGESHPAQAIVARASSLFQPGQTLGTASLEWRTFEDGAVIASLRAHPLLGVGLGNEYRRRTLLQGEASGWLYPLDGTSSLTRFAHNGYLYLAVKVGLPVFAVFLCFWLSLLACGTRLYLRMPASRSSFVTLACLASLAGMLEWAFFEPHFMLASSMATVGVAAGIVMAAGADSTLRGTPCIRPGQAAAMSTAVATTDDGSFRRGVLLTSMGSIVSLVLLFLELLVVARLLTTGDYGRYVLLVTLTNFLVMICDLGCKLSVTQYISVGDRAQQEAVVTGALIFRVGVLAIVAALIAAVHLIPSASHWFTDLDRYLIYVPVMLIAASIDELLFAMLQGFQAYRHLAMAQVLRGALRLTLTVGLLAVFHAGIAAVVYSWAISFAVVIAFQYMVLPTRGVWRWRPETLWSVLRFGRSLQVMRFLGFVSDRLHIALLGALAGVDSVAFFAVANRIPEALQTLGDSYIRVYFPAVSALLAAGRRQAAEELLQRSLRLLSFVSAFGAVTAAVFSREIITLLFSAKYVPAAPAFALLMVAFHMTVMVNVLGYTLTASGRPARALWLDAGQAIALLAGDLIFIPLLGMVGAAAAALAGSYASGPLGVWMIRRSRLALNARPYVRQTGLVVLCVALAWCIHPATLPASLAFRAGVLGLFLIGSIRLTTITRGDFSLVRGRRHASAESTAAATEPAPDQLEVRMPMPRRHICIIAFKPIRQCVHVLRQIDYLAKRYEVTVIGYGMADTGWPVSAWGGVPEPTLFSKAIKLLWFSLGKVFPGAYDAWYWSATRHKRAYEHALASGADAFHANDWQSLPIAVKAAQRTGARVVFHMHEYAEEERMDSVIWRFFVAPAVRHLIKRYTGDGTHPIDAFITVCGPIAERYSRELGAEVQIVFNAPKPVDGLHREQLEDSKPHVQLIHHGYAKRGRGLHKLVAAVALADQRFRLVFMLVDDDAGYIDELRQLADRIAPGRVSFRSTVPPGDIVRCVSQYDIGFCVIEPSSYNNLMMLPNKLFEYIQAGLAVCVGPSPAMAALIEQHGVGVVTDSFNPADVARALNQLTWREIDAMKHAARKAAAVLNSDVEMGKVMTLYQNLLDDPAAVAL